jgi:hypothetical protein
MIDPALPGWAFGVVAMLVALGALGLSAIQLWLPVTTADGAVVTVSGMAEMAVSDPAAPAVAVGVRTREWGVAIRRVELARVELPADDDLLRWAERYAAASARRTP